MKNIVCAYDFSEASQNALKHACRLAEFFSSKLTLIHIYNVPVPVTEYGYIDIGDEELKNNALKELQEIKNNILRAHELITEIEISVETGLVNFRLNELANRCKTDLMVMGIDNDKSFVKEHILGSTAVDEARNFNIPVLIVPKKSDCKKITSIAYACDYKYALDDSTALIQVKFYTTMFNAKLYVVHVLPPLHEIDFVEATRDKFLELKLENTPHQSFFVYEKNAAEGIAEFANEHQIDLIIVEPHQHNFFDRLFHKSTTKELAFHINKPILTIHGS